MALRCAASNLGLWSQGQGVQLSQSTDHWVDVDKVASGGSLLMRNPTFLQFQLLVYPPFLPLRFGEAMSFQKNHSTSWRKLDLALGLPRKDAGGEVSSNSHELVIALPSATHSRNYAEGFRGCQFVTQAISGVPGMVLWVAPLDISMWPAHG